MARKRKVRGRPLGNGEVRDIGNDSAKLRINTFEDVADSEDEFHVNRDKILLDEDPVQKKRRRVQEEEQILEPSDEEILAESDEFSSSSKDDFEDSAGESDSFQKAAKSSRLRKPLQDLDQEGSIGSDEDDDVEGWGPSRKDYYDADAIETEADALEEEAEARRLQQKQLQNMTEADFGFDEVDWLETGKYAEENGNREGVRREILPKLEVTDAMGPEERIKVLQTSYPEFDPLAKEFLDLQAVHQELADVAREAAMVTLDDGSTNVPRTEELGYLSNLNNFATLKHRALSAYLGSLSMYFALLTSGGQSSSDVRASAMPPQELREHTVMDTLVQCRDLWERIKDIPLPDLSSPAQDAAANLDKVEKNAEDDTNRSQLLMNGRIDETLQSTSNERISKHQKKRIRKAKRLALTAQAEANARRQERLRQAELSLESLPDFTQMSAKMSLSKSRTAAKEADNDNNSDFGDATSLTAHEAAEKAKRKKSLKFYTSQIAQKSNKRDGAGRDAGGDADLPYRERLKDRQERLNAEAERRGRTPKASTVGMPLGDDLGEDEGEEPTNAQRRQDGDAGNSDNEYYDLVAKRASDKKASKAADNARAHAAALDSGSSALNPDNAALDADGKRAITYVIEKNKGLHPHRKKDVRNPRVKKRKKFAEKKKKLGSVRAIYKVDREGKGGYGGEKTGIKRGLVRSVKL